MNFWGEFPHAHLQNVAEIKSLLKGKFKGCGYVFGKREQLFAYQRFGGF